MGVLLVAAVLVVGAGCSSSSSSGERTSSSSGERTTGREEANSADRMIFWLGCPEVIGLGDAELDLWRDRGVGGFVCQTQHLRKLGGGEDFTADPNASLTGSNHNLQRWIRDSKIVDRAAARGIKLWLGVYLSNYYNHATPLAEWFDDAAWSTQVVPGLASLAGAARTLGFAGLAFDEEPYDLGTWEWDYPGNIHTEAEVRAKVRERGAQMMKTIVGAYPRVEILDYWTYFPEGWEEYVQLKINGIQNADASKVQIDLWDGLTSVPGYGPIRFLNAVFYKTPHVSHSTWESAYTYEYNRLFAILSRRLSNWAYASSRISESPFVWISAGGTRFEAARDPGYVADQLYAARRWGMARGFAVYAYNGLDGFDYRPYLSAMAAAARPGIVDSDPPRISITKPAKVSSDRGGHLDIFGSATDDLAVRVVRWRTDAGKSGAAEMTWRVESGGPDLGWKWRMDWTAVGVPLHTGDNTITITAEDIKGLTTARTISVHR